MNSTNNLEPRRDLPLHKIPELLAKITGTFSSSFDGKVKKTSINDRIEHCFNEYSNGNASICIDGLLRLCNDLCVQADSYEFFLFCYLCRAKQMFCLTREEFERGWKSLGEDLQHLSELRSALIHFHFPSNREDFYHWTFHFALNDGQTSLTSVNAIALWKLFYSKNCAKSSIVDQWFEYLEEEMIHDVPKMITFDTWKIFPQFVEFLQCHGFDLYDDNDGWPSLFDGFVDYQREKRSIRKK